MADVGRNDPCPCGSGRKYKKCCLEKDEARWRIDERERQVRSTVVSGLLDFVDQPEFDDDHQVADLLFWSDRIVDLSAADARALVDHDDSLINYNTWFLFDLDIDEGRTVADMFREEQGDDLDPDELAFLDRMQRSYLSLYQIERVDPDVGLALLDLWTGARIFVEERLVTQGVVQWDFVAARVVREPDGRSVLEGGLYFYPLADREAIVKHFRRLHRRFLKRVPEASNEMFFKRHGQEFNHLWLDYVVLRPPPRLQTADGEDLIFSRATFTLLDEGRVREVLASDPELETGEDGSFTWRAGEGQAGRWQGTWSIVSGRLRFEGWSVEQAARARQWIEARAATAVRYRVTSYKPWLTDAGAEPELPVEETPEEAARLLGEYLDEYYHQWLDEPVPALDGDTPRHASTVRAMRPRVVDLLKQMENLEARGREAALTPPYDFGWMWTELGLTRPTG